MIYRLGNFTFDVDNYELRHKGQAVSIEPQVFDLLRLLIEHRDRIVSKKELFQTIWKDRIVSDAALSSRIKAARQAIGDDGSTQKYIKTIHGRGFRFIGNVVAEDVPTPEQSGGEKNPLQLGVTEHKTQNRPTIAVLPFRNLGDDPKQIYFSDGITEEIIILLSKFRWLLVISSNSTFQYRQPTTATADIAQELNVRYIVTGSTRKYENRVRVAAQLIDVDMDRNLWADRYDLEIDNIFDVQDEIASNIISAVAPESLLAEIRRAKTIQERNLDAWDLAMRAHSHLRRLTQADNEEAKRLLQKAIKLNPEGAFAFSDLAFCFVFDIMFSWSDSYKKSLKSAEDAARRSVRLDNRDALGYMALGWVAHIQRKHDDAIEGMNNALVRNPNLADAYGYLAMILAFAGEVGSVRNNVNLALRLSPHDPNKAFWFDALAMAAYVKGDHPLAVRWAEKSIEENADYVGALRVLAASYGQTGQLEKAKLVVDEIKNQVPGLTCTETALRMPFRTKKDQNLYIEGLRKAGLPK